MRYRGDRARKEDPEIAWVVHCREVSGRLIVPFDEGAPRMLQSRRRNPGGGAGIGQGMMVIQRDAEGIADIGETEALRGPIEPDLTDHIH